MLNIVVPMAGEGLRFQEKGFLEPKPLIPIHGKPMIQIVIENLRTQSDSRFIFLVLKKHLSGFDLERKLQKWTRKPIKIVPINEVTEGAACTVLLAKSLIDSDDSLVIANSDQCFSCSMDEFVGKARDQDGLIMTMIADTPEWSYAKSDKNGQVLEVAEKKIISPEATVGIYYFRRGCDFVHAAQEMISANDRVKGEFYVAPVYNYLIRDQKRIRTFCVGSFGEGMFSFGTPAHLESFLKHPKSSQIVDRI